jgi:hypothetical protein
MAFYMDFKREDYNQVYDIPDGEWEVKISAAAEAKKNKNGKQYLSVQLLVNTQTQVLPYELQIWEGEYFNKAMSKFCDAFELADADVPVLLKYKGLRGKASFTHKIETYTDPSGVPKTVNRCKCNLIVPDGRSKPLAQAPQPAEVTGDIWG